MLELVVNINAFQHGRLMLNEKLVHSSNYLMERFYLFAWLDPGGDFLFYLFFCQLGYFCSEIVSLTAFAAVFWIFAIFHLIKARIFTLYVVMNKLGNTKCHFNSERSSVFNQLVVLQINCLYSGGEEAVFSFKNAPCSEIFTLKHLIRNSPQHLVKTKIKTCNDK